MSRTTDALMSVVDLSRSTANAYYVVRREAKKMSSCS